jgi:hypothetical protein
MGTTAFARKGEKYPFGAASIARNFLVLCEGKFSARLVALEVSPIPEGLTAECRDVRVGQVLLNRSRDRSPVRLWREAADLACGLRHRGRTTIHGDTAGIVGLNRKSRNRGERYHRPLRLLRNDALPELAHLFFRRYHQADPRLVRSQSRSEWSASR